MYVYITSTGLGQKPQTDSIYIDKGEDNLIEITGIEVTDDDFANDGIVSAGEYGAIKIDYKVLSDEPIDPSKFFISCSSSYIDIESSKRRIIGTNQLIFPFQAKGGTPELNEHNCNAPLVYLYYSTGDKVLCIDCFHISVAKLKGEVRDVSYNLLSNTNGYEYKIAEDMRQLSYGLDTMRIMQVMVEYYNALYTKSSTEKILDRMEDLYNKMEGYFVPHAVAHTSVGLFMPDALARTRLRGLIKRCFYLKGMKIKDKD